MSDEIRTLTTFFTTQYKDTDKLVVAWWDKSWFEEMLGLTLTDTQWENILQEVENERQTNHLATMFTEIADELISIAERSTAKWRK